MNGGELGNASFFNFDEIKVLHGSNQDINVFANGIASGELYLNYLQSGENTFLSQSLGTVLFDDDGLGTVSVDLL